MEDAHFDGEDYDHVLLDHDVGDLLTQMSDAKTWGEAFRGFPEAFEALNKYRDDDDEPPRRAEDVFDCKAELQSEYGIAYQLMAYRLNAIVHVDVPGVRRVIDRMDYDQTFVKDHEAAALLRAALKENYGDKAVLTHDDDFIEWIYQGCFNG
jgi:hypothetical protein